jgi:hypothetical protein
MEEALMLWPPPLLSLVVAFNAAFLRWIMCFVAALARLICRHQPAAHHSAVHRMAIQAVDNTAVLLVDISEWASWATAAGPGPLALPALILSASSESVSAVSMPVDPLPPHAERTTAKATAIAPYNNFALMNLILPLPTGNHVRYTHNIGSILDYNQ